MVKSVIWAKAVQFYVSCILAAGVFWWVAEHSGPPEGAVIVHVMERGVELDLAGRVYEFSEMTDEPLVVPMLAGTYNFRVRRGESVLHEETFTVRGGQTAVLVAVRDDRGRDLGGEHRCSAQASALLQPEHDLERSPDHAGNQLPCVRK